MLEESCGSLGPNLLGIHVQTLDTLRLTNMEVENPLFVEESSLPRDHFPLPC